MDASLEHGSWKIASVMGIPIRVHFSWFVIFGLIAWSLSTAYFPRVAPDLPVLSYWAGGLVAALLLFLSVAFHELSHSLVAKKYRLAISSITLFIFGGVSQMKGEPPTPEAERAIAVAGPLSSFFLSLLFFLLYGVAEGRVARALFSYLSQLNLVLGAFNLIPGFPMDGGRVLRAFLWNRSGDFFSATRKASRYGQNISLFFIFFGLFSLVAGFPGAIWLMVIGWFLHSAAQSSYRQANLQETLGGIKVKDIMVRDIVTIPSDLSLDMVVNNYFLRYGYGGFPVMNDEEFLGFVSLKEIKNVPRAEWRKVRVSDIIEPFGNKWEISMTDDAMKALELMLSEDRGRLAVMDHGKVIGLITRNGIASYTRIMGR
jgi:Zn-dependent protease/predicted transcriptional regulator